MECVLKKFGSYENFEDVTGGNILPKSQVWAAVRKYLQKEGCVGEVSDERRAAWGKAQVLQRLCPGGGTQTPQSGPAPPPLWLSVRGLDGTALVELRHKVTE